MFSASLINSSLPQRHKVSWLLLHALPQSSRKLTLLIATSQAHSVSLLSTKDTRDVKIVCDQSNIVGTGEPKNAKALTSFPGHSQ